MRAAICHFLAEDRSGLRVETGWAEPPAPGAGEVTVAMTHAGLNFPDLLMLSGGYQFRPDLPFVPGVEGAGHIVAVGEDVSGELIGERVVVGTRSGCLAERLTLPLGAVRSVPGGLHDAAAAGFTVAALTAWVGLVERGRLVAGERVLVCGAGGGMGWAAVQLVLAREGHAVAATSDPAKGDLLCALGAEVVIVDRAAPAFELRNIDIVFDPVGGALTLPAMRMLRWGGRHLMIGFAGGDIPRLPLNRLLLKGIEVVGVRAGEAGRQDAGAGAAHIRAIDALADRMTPHVGLTVALEDVGEAFAAMAAGRVTGKAVVAF
ncbi:alcohol dehydrogenase catalytic domain-containing protein [Glacieibacterium frigidum]|uniref:Zinc-binding dehydrogenase n=1 Tax=Glacieibacterium frigidum TaxID=2593303 RepID=A0A552UID1_9SPHN|nr:zinc-binding dehydrogenase [Glacieibacterium frigidum]TRW17985.1 zinc-binding dehydrogenase [Glacieibacterium frigidum]